MKQAEAMISRQVASGDLDKEYLPIEGNVDFCALSAKFVLGDDSTAISEGRVVTMQTLSGTGSLAVAGSTLNIGNIFTEALLRCLHTRRVRPNGRPNAPLARRLGRGCATDPSDLSLECRSTQTLYWSSLLARTLAWSTQAWYRFVYTLMVSSNSCCPCACVLSLQSTLGQLLANPPNPPPNSCRHVNQLWPNVLHAVAPSVKDIYLPSPSWGNHQHIFRTAGIDVKSYAYLDQVTRTSLDFGAMKADLEDCPTGSVVLLHACAHNPTGLDPTPAQWEQLAAVFLDRELTPLFDTAYQGYATGDTDLDAFSVRTFTEQGAPQCLLLHVCWRLLCTRMDAESKY